jgi:hypothetical protein
VSIICSPTCPSYVPFQGPSGADKRMRTTSSATRGPAGRASPSDDGSSDGDRGSVAGTGKNCSAALLLFIRSGSDVCTEERGEAMECRGEKM